MKTIEYFLSKLFMFALIFGGIIFTLIVLQKFFPELLSKFNLRGNGSFFTDSWLPDPVNLQELTKPKTADLSNQVPESTMTPGTSYVIYGENGMEIVKVPDNHKITKGEAIPIIENAPGIRNLSLNKEDSIKIGTIFYGEAKNTFFLNGTFPVYLFDSQSRVFSKEVAISTGQWSVPGWSRFYVKINSQLPMHQSCQIMFTPDPNSQDKNINYRAILPVVCN